MRRLQFVPFVAVGLLWLAGCPVKPRPGECRSSVDCAAEGGLGAVCVEGRCQECGADADCKQGFVCRSWRCLPKPECAADADCPDGKACEEERCVARRAVDKAARECAAHVDCGEGRLCDADGRCVDRPLAEEAACADAATWVVRFGFDESALGGDGQEKLQKVAGCLRARPAGKIVVSGHCDERGTTEYNLALGARRAEAARKYLGDLGVAGAMETVTLGKERPLCTESTESCWAQNRRAEILVSR
jgi:peptidoglycan-associated lipoprotein